MTCHHVMFLRTTYINISTFDVSILYARYFRSREENIFTSPTSNNGSEEEDLSGNRIEEFISGDNESMYNIGNLASCCYYSNQFLDMSTLMQKINSMNK